MKAKRIYISGKISGIEQEAPSLFEAAEIFLRLKGFEPVNPMKLNHDHDKTWHSYMKEDIKALCSCDEIYMLNNWQDSKGAIIEMTIAAQIGIKINFEK